MKNNKIIPIFNNPNLPIENFNTNIINLNNQKTELVDSNILIKTNIKENKDNSMLQTDQNINNVLMQNLVFIQKKGSIKPNPNIIGYSFYKSKDKFKNSTLKNFNINSVYKFLFSSFKSMYCLISKPVFISTSDVIKIQLFYFVCLPKVLTKRISYKKSLKSRIKLRSKLSWLSKSKKVKINLINLAVKNIIDVYPKKFESICNILSQYFNKRVELDLIRLHNNFNNSNILVNYLGLIINKRNISMCVHKLLKKKDVIKKPVHNFKLDSNNSITELEKYIWNKSKAVLSGLHIKIRGRLMREPIIPRITTKKFEKGFTAKGKVNYLDIGRYTHRNRKGAFTITIKGGQNL